MTQIKSLAEKIGSKQNQSQSGQSLSLLLKQHVEKERASFHTPGHKGRLGLDIEELAGGLFKYDLTELPGLDELASANEVLGDLQKRLAKRFGSRASYISLNGASAALTAAIIAVSAEGSTLALPRNAHRSAATGLVLSGLEPAWYEGQWMDEWQTWSAPEPGVIASLLARKKAAALLLVSPNYAGAMAELAQIADICRKAKTLLIVDEAHGAHLYSSHFGSPSSGNNAISAGADIVVHSLHKTLSAPTQTGVLHIANCCRLESENFLSALNLLQSSSPSYLLMSGIEKCLDQLDDEILLARAAALARSLKEELKGLSDYELFSCKEQDPMHFLIRHKNLSAQCLYEQLAENGVYAEAQLGSGVLLMTGLLSQESDLAMLISALQEIARQNASSTTDELDISKRAAVKPEFLEEELSPRQAFFSKTRICSADSAEEEIAAQWFAPCPPGHLVVSPGQPISKQLKEFISSESKIRVVDKSPVRRSH